MSRQQIIYRFLSTSSHINTNRLKSGKMSAEEWKYLSLTMKHLAQLPIFIDDNSNLTLTDIRSKLRKIFKDKTRTGLIIIDYLQLMKLNFKLENRVQEISYITRNLKILAKEFEIPILVLSQLSRGVESRVNKRPMLSDLRESGCLGAKNFLSFGIHSWNKQVIQKNKKDFFLLKGIKPTFLLRLPKKEKICLTSNHKVLSKQGWIHLFQLAIQNPLYLLNSTYLEGFKFQIEKKGNETILYSGIKKVYDQTIPTYHNYIYTPLVLHNSIEQDADIVIMLYRDDYYAETSSKNEHVTEFIIAKHRNGPVGTVELEFDANITCFRNKKN
jgi:replicative DNA helicase